MFNSECEGHDSNNRKCFWPPCRFVIKTKVEIEDVRRNVTYSRRFSESPVPNEAKYRKGQILIIIPSILEVKISVIDLSVGEYPLLIYDLCFLCS